MLSVLDLSIYVNPDSLEELELGTRAHPYKSIIAAMKEVLNEHHGSAEDISIFIKEGTINYFSEKMVTLNIGSLSLSYRFIPYSDRPYTDMTGKEPEKASLIYTDIQQP